MYWERLRQPAMPALDGGQAIADAGFCQQVAGFGRVVFDFCAQLCHVESQVMRVVDEFFAPDIDQQLAVCDDFAAVAAQPRREPASAACGQSLSTELLCRPR